PSTASRDASLPMLPEPRRPNRPTRGAGAAPDADRPRGRAGRLLTVMKASVALFAFSQIADAGFQAASLCPDRAAGPSGWLVPVPRQFLSAWAGLTRRPFWWRGHHPLPSGTRADSRSPARRYHHHSSAPIQAARAPPRTAPAAPPMNAPTRLKAREIAEVMIIARKLLRAAPRACRPAAAPTWKPAPMMLSTNGITSV